MTLSIDPKRMSAHSLTVTGILCITAACSGQANAPQSSMLTTELPGHASAFMRAEVLPQVTGTILQRQFEEGTDVRAGQVLYQIDPRTYQIAFNSAKARLSLAEALAARLRLRLRRPVDPKVIKQQDDDMDAEYKLAQADVEAARAALDRARIDLEATCITAPISGRIGRSTVTSGDLVIAGQPTALATVLQIDPIYVDVAMSSTDIQHVMQKRTRSKQQQAGGAPVQVRLRLSDGIEYAYAGKLQFPEVPARHVCWFADPERYSQRLNYLADQRKLVSEHRIAALGLRTRRFVLNDVPVLSENSVLHADNIHHDPIGYPFAQS
jgi:multidrug efflux pump subunit AcrA (membrane-fusion protein)